MKICLIGPAYPYRGGIAHFNSVLAGEFALSHEVQIINFTRLYPSFLFPGKTQYDESGSPLEVESHRVIDCLNPVTWLRAGKAAAAFEPDLVVFQWWQPFFGPAYRVVCHALRRRSDATIVFLCHNVLPHETSMLDHGLISVGLSGADAYLVQSTQDETNLRRIRHNPVSALNPHPIYDVFNQGVYDRLSARESLGLDGPVILFFGYVRSYKGLGVLLEAFAKVAENLGATLLIVGEFYEKREPYDTRISRLGIEHRVRIVDEYVPNEDVEMYFKAADVVVLPYLTATQSGIVQMAFGFEKPVIVTSVGGLPDVVKDGETGFVVPRNDPDSLATALNRFFDNNLAGPMAEGIRADLDRFSWSRCVDTLISLGERAGKRVQKL